jgi:hypothetical protein
MVTTAPPPERSGRAPACFIPSDNDVWSMAITRSHRSAVPSSTVARLPLPALLTSASSPPCTRSTSAVTAAH